jgi:hypothetical protein
MCCPSRSRVSEVWYINPLRIFWAHQQRLDYILSRNSQTLLPIDGYRFSVQILIERDLVQCVPGNGNCFVIVEYFVKIGQARRTPQVLNSAGDYTLEN